MYRPDSEEKEMLDPGLVLTGTKCGSHHVGTSLEWLGGGSEYRFSTQNVLCAYQAIYFLYVMLF